MMSIEQSERERETCPSEPNNLHRKSFKLRFASQRELGRSYVSAIKPLGLPAAVSSKEWGRVAEDAAGAREENESTLRRVQELFTRGPRDKYRAPVTSAQEYGWWSVQRTADTGLLAPPRHHIADSAWLKERLRVLAADYGLKRR
ncbi:uncharacterized protein LOC133319010 [Danaus plexippus]|uniref:uncharacterized protein LOC133319010 n=1 Tax=Danaus plexippus TaxID=13037 RepID=UPI002AAF64B5|nr:uncharacterized protein LOC133319010 [Danaus plexippus]